MEGKDAGFSARTSGAGVGTATGFIAGGAVLMMPTLAFVAEGSVVLDEVGGFSGRVAVSVVFCTSTGLRCW